MPFAPFHTLFPDIGAQETRSVTVLPGSPLSLPPDEYAFLETYCDEPHCDCRRVLFTVLSRARRAPQAVIGWGWENPGFYFQWSSYGTLQDALELKGPALNLLSPATALAPALVNLTRTHLLTDPAYIARLQRHYAMFRARIDRRR